MTPEEEKELRDALQEIQNDATDFLLGRREDYREVLTEIALRAGAALRPFRFFGDRDS